jgi:hypothetical protein
LARSDADHLEALKTARDAIADGIAAGRLTVDYMIRGRRTTTEASTDALQRIEEQILIYERKARPRHAQHVSPGPPSASPPLLAVANADRAPHKISSGWLSAGSGRGIGAGAAESAAGWPICFKAGYSDGLVAAKTRSAHRRLAAAERCRRRRFTGFDNNLLLRRARDLVENNPYAKSGVESLTSPTSSAAESPPSR